MCRLRPLHGFTLIELLVVIAIITLLIGILLPALGQASEAGRAAACLSNMRQMAIATFNYTIDQDGRLPGVGLSHGSESFNVQGSWLAQLEPYVDTPLLYRCPSDDSPFFTQPASTGRERQTSYATNFLLTGRQPGFEPYADLDQITRPTVTIFAAELTESDDAGFATADHIHPDLFIGNPATTDTRVLRQVEARRHLGRANYAFLDGHAAAHAIDQTFDIDPGSSLGDTRFLANKYFPNVAR